MERTSSYQFTTTDRNDDRIVMMKKVIAATNRMSRDEARIDAKYGRAETTKLYRVRLMPRGPRVEAAWSDYRSRRAYDSYLPMRHATHYDVYIHRDTTAERNLKREIETGLTPGQLRKLDKEEHARMMYGVEMHQRLREAGIYLDSNNEYVSEQKRRESLVERGVPPHLIERVM